MTNEFRKLREKLGMTQAAVSTLLDVPLRTIESWEQDPDTVNARKPNRIAVRVLRWIEQGKLKP